jgi:hypothetical protein
MQWKDRCIGTSKCSSHERRSDDSKHALVASKHKGWNISSWPKLFVHIIKHCIGGRRANPTSDVVFAKAQAESYEYPENHSMTTPIEM